MEKEKGLPGASVGNDNILNQKFINFDVPIGQAS